MSSRPSQVEPPAEPKRIGRPPGTGAPQDQKRKPRSVRANAARWAAARPILQQIVDHLSDAQWAKLRRLGPDWLERAIDRARA